ncbi:MAG: MoxR family ATPase [Sphingomonas sp.]|nr:ATPase [Parvibaculum sp.]MBY0305346.1 MoxR family ATPase [Sphingomonas sp.]
MITSPPPLSHVGFREALAQVGYVCDEMLATALSIAARLERPLLLEGEAGVGKTQVATSLALALNRRLIRLQCYEGLDSTHALYEWNYQRQILAIAAARESGRATDDAALFSDTYLIRRPLLEAISQEEPPILLIDEVDRADEEFEAFLLEILADYAVTIPELGTISAVTRPFVLITSNGVRDLSDALRRRCLFHYIDFPDPATEMRIIEARHPGCSIALAGQIAHFIRGLREQDLKKLPGIAETLDWAAALLDLGVNDLSHDPVALHRTLLCVLKTREDRETVALPIFERLAAGAL